MLRPFCRKPYYMPVLPQHRAGTGSPGRYNTHGVVQMTVQTSLVAYQKVLPTLTRRQQEVLDALEGLGGSATMHRVAMHILRPLHCISGRFGELVKKERIWISSYEFAGGSWRAIYTLNAPAPDAISGGLAGAGAGEARHGVRRHSNLQCRPYHLLPLDGSGKPAGDGGPTSPSPQARLCSRDSSDGANASDSGSRLSSCPSHARKEVLQ